VTDERQAISILEGEHNAVARAYATAFLAHALIDSGDLELAADQLDALPLTDPAQLAPYAVAVAARGRLRLLQATPKVRCQTSYESSHPPAWNASRPPSCHGAARPHWPSYSIAGQKQRNSRPKTPSCRDSRVPPGRKGWGFTALDSPRPAQTASRY
jgi:hypothetical protein